MQNQMELTFSARPQNEAFARVAIAAFAVQLNPTLPEMADIKTAVSEAVTNAIVHGYRDREDGMVTMRAEYGERRLLPCPSVTRAAALRTWKPPCSRFTPPATARSAAAWAFA